MRSCVLFLLKMMKDVQLRRVIIIFKRILKGALEEC